MPASRATCSSLLAALLLAACAAAPATAGLVAVPAGAKRTLHVRGKEPREMHLHLWNRGPATVECTPIAPLRLEPPTSLLAPASGDCRWQVVGTTLSIELRGGAEDATVGYELRTDGRVSVDVELH